MVDAAFIGQLVSSMEDAVLQLEQAVENKEVEKVNELRTFIFDLHRQIDEATSEGVKNV
jgi:hypothetical protein